MFYAKILGLYFVMLFVSCASPSESIKVLKTGMINKTEKTITVPSVGAGIFEIKNALIQNGWKTKVDNATLEEKGTKSESINTNTKTSFDTAYRLYMTSTQSPNNNLGIITFSLSVVDNKTNEEILTMAGNREDHIRYDPELIGSRLVESLSEIQSN